MINKRSSMIKKIEEIGEIRPKNPYNLKKLTALVGTAAIIYFGQGILKGFGEIENQQMARKMKVPAIEQNYTGYICLGAKNLAEKIYSALK